MSFNEKISVRSTGLIDLKAEFSRRKNLAKSNIGLSSELFVPGSFVKKKAAETSSAEKTVDASTNSQTKKQETIEVQLEHDKMYENMVKKSKIYDKLSNPTSEQNFKVTTAQDDDVTLENEDDSDNQYYLVDFTKKKFEKFQSIKREIIDEYKNSVEQQSFSASSSSTPANYSSFIKETSKYNEGRHDLEEEDGEVGGGVRRPESEHYANLMQGEARTHGTGFYRFSGDLEEKQRQLAEFERMDAETRRQNAAAEAERKVRLRDLEIRLEKVRKRRNIELDPAEVLYKLRGGESEPKQRGDDATTVGDGDEEKDEAEAEEEMNNDAANAIQTSIESLLWAARTETLHEDERQQNGKQQQQPITARRLAAKQQLEREQSELQREKTENRNRRRVEQSKREWDRGKIGPKRLGFADAARKSKSNDGDDDDSYNRSNKTTAYQRWKKAVQDERVAEFAPPENLYK